MSAFPTPSIRLAVATSAAFPGIHPDDAHLAHSLRALGIEPVACVWNDPALDWSGFDAVLVRTIWDYFQHHADFLAWLDRLDGHGMTVLNPTATLRWNSDKRYLMELARHGVAVIPTRVAAAGTLHDTLREDAGRDVVVKPAVGGGAWHTVRGRVGDARFDAAAARLPATIDYLVQPFVPEVVDAGEWSLAFFDGTFSHAVLKRPLAGDYRVQHEHGGSSGRADPDTHVIDAAQHILAAAAACGHAGHAYARVDGVVVDGRFVLMELEMIEPGLFLDAVPEAAERYARNLARRLRGPDTVRDRSPGQDACAARPMPSGNGE